MGKASAFVAGVGAAYLLDPTLGRQRRHVLHERTSRLLKRIGRLPGSKLRFTPGRLRGVAARVRGSVLGPSVATDDEAASSATSAST